MKFKLFALMLCGVMLGGCTAGTDDSNNSASEESTGLKIAIVTSPSGVDDGNYNENNYDGILAYIEDHPDATVTAMQETTGDVTACIQMVSDIVADYDVIVTPGFQFAGVSSVAVENPDKKFILVDAPPAPVGDQTEFDNLYSMEFAEEEAGFFVGVAAALETETNVVAIINGIAFPSNVNAQYGFECGVNYANEVFGTDVEVIELPSYSGVDVTGANVGGNYVGTFSDPATGKIVANNLIDQNADVLFVFAGASGGGALTAAKETGDVLIIGADVDQYEDGQMGDKNIMLTSAIKAMDLNVELLLNAITDGTFEGGHHLRKADTDSVSYAHADGRHLMSDDTLAKLEQVYADVKSGKIVPASNFNGLTPDTFTGLPSAQ
ncbi:MAG: BMP family ABC transporter substrate-binding protein [Candidatus Epulonipiscioides saccharophilum]|nr:MAG: BMP family ABC transporter substrate-binding protein [Epulopiscium sp. AS2M-Bin001]